jgi:hypothetical protein
MGPSGAGPIFENKFGIAFPNFLSSLPLLLDHLLSPLFLFQFLFIVAYGFLHIVAICFLISPVFFLINSLVVLCSLAELRLRRFA